MIIARKVFGVLLWAFSLWLLFTSLKPLMFQLRQTQDLEAALADPVFFLPIGASVLGILGGIMILAGWPFGAGMGLLGAIIYAVYGLGILVLGGDEAMWFPKLVCAGLAAILALGAFRLPRRLN